MAQSVLSIVEQGDTFTIHYLDKRGRTVRTITAVPVDPAGTAQTAVTVAHVSDGIYSYDFDTTAKALGAWRFVVLDGSKEVGLYVINVVNSGLSDSVFKRIITNISAVETKVDNIDTEVGAIQTDVTSIEGKVDTVDTVVDGIATDVTTIDGKVDVVDTNVDTVVSEVQNGTYGLSEIKDAVDAIAPADEGGYIA